MRFAIRNLKIRQQILLFTLPPLIVLLCAVGLAFFVYWSVSSSGRAVLRSKERVIRNQSFIGHVTQIYYDVQRIVVNHQNNMMETYERMVADGVADLKTLDELEADDPGQEQEVAKIREDFESFRNLWAQATIELARPGGNFDTTSAMAEGQQRWTAIRTEAFKLQREDEKQNVGEMQGAERMTWIVLVAGVGLTVLLAGHPDLPEGRVDAPDCDSGAATHSSFGASWAR